MLPAKIKVFGADGAACGGEFGGVEEAFAGHCDVERLGEVSFYELGFWKGVPGIGGSEVVY